MSLKTKLFKNTFLLSIIFGAFLLSGIWIFASFINTSNSKYPFQYSVGNISVYGSGEILKAKSFMDGDQLNYLVLRYGYIEKPYVVFTFDDGPDPIYTPQILEVLKKYNIKAVFFVVGKNAEKYPEIVNQIIKDGHIIGNHTYSHINIQKTTREKFLLDAAKNEKLLEKITGKKITLFRIPYNSGTSPMQTSDTIIINDLNNLGYSVVGTNIDSTDYDKPSVNIIKGIIFTRLEQTKGNIILMHDAGGDRTQTVETLKMLIPLLIKKGYQIGSMPELLNTNKDLLMPSISK